MARIAGVDLKDNWKLDFALTRIEGIGWTKSGEIMSALKFDKTMRVSNLTSDDVARIASFLEGYTVEGDLVRKVREDIHRLREIGSYRGIRHARGLPARGQRTRSNARTKRGKRRTVGAFKKDVIAKMTTTAAKK